MNPTERLIAAVNDLLGAAADIPEEMQDRLEQAVSAAEGHSIIESRERPHSIEIRRGAKAEYGWTIKMYHDNGEARETMERIVDTEVELRRLFLTGDDLSVALAASIETLQKEGQP